MRGDRRDRTRRSWSGRLRSHRQTSLVPLRNWLCLWITTLLGTVPSSSQYEATERCMRSTARSAGRCGVGSPRPTALVHGQAPLQRRAWRGTRGGVGATSRVRPRGSVSSMWISWRRRAARRGRRRLGTARQGAARHRSLGRTASGLRAACRCDAPDVTPRTGPCRAAPRPWTA